MFRSKKEQKENKAEGNTASSTSTTTVQQSANGYTITRQISSESHVHRERFSMTVNNISSRVPSRSIFDVGNTSNGSSERNRDAVPFSTGTFVASPNSYGANRPRLYGSRSHAYYNYPLPSIQPTARSETISQAPTHVSNIARQPQPVASNPSILPTYVHKSQKLGKALLINNILFKGKNEERQGAKKDSDDLDKVLKRLGFEVEHKNDLKGQAMLARVKQFSQSSFSRHSISLVVIMSHGNNLVQNGNQINAIPGGFTQISGIDHQPVLTDDIIDQFTMGNCHSSLNGKPKIFIFQCCRGEKDLAVCHDAAPIKKPMKQYADVLVAFSTLPGYLSNRSPVTGTWYIQSLCDVFEKYQKQFHVEEMLKLVDDQLGSKHPLYTQTSTYESRGFKCCYLYKNS